jgi:hypothetical protein
VISSGPYREQGMRADTSPESCDAGERREEVAKGA